MSTSDIRVIGMDEVLARLNNGVRRIEIRTKKGMIAAGLFLQRASQKMTPVDLANLRSSAFTIWGPGKGRSSPSFSGDDAAQLTANHENVMGQDSMDLNTKRSQPEVEVGYSAFYAIFVHEDMEANHTTGENKFLEKAIIHSVDKMLDIIEQEAWIG